MLKILKIHGVNLLELVIAMAILLLISYLVLSATLTNRAASATAGAAIYINSQVSQAASTITRELMEAKRIGVTVDDSYIDNGQTLYRRIRFQIPVLDANEELVAAAGGGTAFGDGQTEGNFIRYTLIGTDLLRQTLAADQTTVLTSTTLAKNLLANTGFRTPDVSGSTRYNITLSFSISSYEGTTLPSPITSSITIAASPQN